MADNLLNNPFVLVGAINGYVDIASRKPIVRSYEGGNTHAIRNAAILTCLLTVAMTTACTGETTEEPPILVICDNPNDPGTELYGLMFDDHNNTYTGNIYTGGPDFVMGSDGGLIPNEDWVEPQFPPDRPGLTFGDNDIGYMSMEDCLVHKDQVQRLLDFIRNLPEGGLDASIPQRNVPMDRRAGRNPIRQIGSQAERRAMTKGHVRF